MAASNSNFEIRDRFVCYDPLMGRCSSDFTGIDKARIIFLGELHHCPNLQRDQQSVIKTYAQGKAALIMEGVHPDYRPSKEDLPLTRDLPVDLDIYGSDCRVHNTSPKKYFELRAEENRIYEALDQQRRQKTQVLARLLHNAGETEDLYITKGGELCLTDDAMKVIGGISLSIPELAEKAKKVAAAIHTLDFVPETPGEFSASNQSLFDKIKSVWANYQTVFVVGGIAHFTIDSSFYKKLDALEVPYMVVLPNKTARRLAEGLLAKKDGPGKYFRFSVANYQPTGPTTANLTRISYQGSFEYLRLYPRIVRLHARCIHWWIGTEAQQDRKLKLQDDTLALIFQQANPMVFQANSTVKIPCADEKYRLMLSNHAAPVKVDLIKAVLNQKLLFTGRRIGNMHEEVGAPPSVDFKFTKHGFDFRFHLNANLRLETHDRYLVADPSYLFRAMIRRRQRSFVVKAGQELILTGFSQDEVKFAMETPVAFLNQLVSKWPPYGFQFRISIGKDLLVIHTKRDLGLEVEDGECLVLRSPTPFTIYTPQIPEK